MRYRGFIAGLFLFSSLTFADSITVYSNATGMDHSVQGTDYASINEKSDFGGVEGSVSMGGDGTTYNISGTFNTYKNIIVGGGAPSLLGADIELTLNLPSDSGNWVITGYESAQDDEQPKNFTYYTPVNITLNHTYGTPISYRRSFGVGVEEQDSFDNLQFNLQLVDPISPTATPEPSSFALLLLPFVLFTFNKWRKSF